MIVATSAILYIEIVIVLATSSTIYLKECVFNIATIVPLYSKMEICLNAYNNRYNTDNKIDGEYIDYMHSGVLYIKKLL